MQADLLQWTDDELGAWRPPERLTVSQWADQFRMLDAKTSAEPGRYSSLRTPYSREWMDSANCPWVRQVTIIAGTQLGKTETLNNVVGYAIHQDPGPTMVVVPRNQDVRLAAQRRLQPMIEASPVLRAEMTGAEHDVKNVEIAFRRSIVYLRSSQSPADLASVPVRYLLADEVDKYPRWAGNEAAPLDLAKERQKTFWNSICYVTTTPTTRDATGWVEFEDGDQRHFWVPCPSCGKHQRILWSQVRYPAGTDVQAMRRDKLATYECLHCKASIPDSAKSSMLARGIWVPQAFGFEQWVSEARHHDREEHRSYHLWSGYSPWVTWSQLATTWLTSKGRPEKLQNWVNSWLAEPWEEKVEAPTADALARAIVPGHRIGQVPDGVMVATAGVDVQKDGLWLVVRGWGWDEETWLLFAGKVGTFDELEDVLFRNVWTARGNGLRAVVIDSRHRRDECIELARRQQVVHLGEGVDRLQPIDFTTHKLERHPVTGAYLKSSVMIWSITVARFKDSLAHRMRDPAKWHLPEDIDEHYRRHMVAEQKIRRRIRNRDREVWVVKPGSDANHLWDAEVYALAAAKMIRVELLRKDGSKPASAPAPPTRPRRLGGNFPRLGS